MDDSYIVNGKLYHHGIKGQKWGERKYQNEDGSLTPAGEQRYLSGAERRAAKKAAKAVKKVEKTHAKAGDAAGRSDYYRQKGDEASKKFDDNAKSLDKIADSFEKEGKILRAEAARKLAQRQRDKGAKARESYDTEAQEWLEVSEYYSKKASKIATKKNVDIGKKRINEIVKNNKVKGFEDEKSSQDFDNLWDSLTINLDDDD